MLQKATVFFVCFFTAVDIVTVMATFSAITVEVTPRSTVTLNSRSHGKTSHGSSMNNSR